jgi:3-hydroxyisobutyrate dehydrogenase
MNIVEEEARHIGFVGAGNIGAPMARTLLHGGFPIKMCDFSEAVRREFQDLGCETTGKASDLATLSAVVIMVNTAEQLVDVLFGPDGLTAGLQPSDRPLIIVTSTILPDVIIDISRQLASSGLRLIDAPVSGGPIPAAEGKLTIMAGGDPADIERAAPILELLAERIVICGPIGSGQKTKIINNLVGITNQLMMAEALAMAVRSGLDRACLLSAMDNSSGRNFWSREWALTQAQYTEYAKVALDDAYIQRSAKDLELARQLASSMRLSTPLLDTVTDATAAMRNADVAKRFHDLAQ